MSHTVFLWLVFVITAGMYGQGIAQKDQGGGLWVRIGDFRGNTKYPRPTKSATIKNLPRMNSTRILSGVRRLVPLEYPTIRAAIDSSADGDTVLVSDGTYFENIRFHGKAITVASHFLIDDDTSHIAQTIINGSNPSHPDSASVVYFIDGEDTTSVLCGFTITGGAGTLWTNQDLWRSGGGVFCVGAFGAEIINNRITGNSVSGENASGGGVEFFGDHTFFILEGNQIIGNRVSANPGSGYSGGADIWGNGIYARIVENVFEQDTVTGQDFSIGGAVWLGPQSLDSLVGCVIQGNVFRGNIADAVMNNGVGGGLYGGATVNIKITDNHFENNIARSQNAWAEGGALLFEDRDVIGYGRKIIARNQFVGNMASSQFGNASGGALELFFTLATVSSNSFYQNSVVGGQSEGGAIRINSSAYCIENNILSQNSSLLGGGIFIGNPPQSGTDREFINNTIINNSSGSSGGGFSVGSGVRPIILNTILWGNIPDQITSSDGGSVAAYYNDIEGGWSGKDNISINPSFKDTTTYQLSDSSLCIGMGRRKITIENEVYTAPAFDFQGNQRPDPTDTLVDMGARESSYPAPAQLMYSTVNYNKSYIHPTNDSLHVGVKMLNPHRQNITIHTRLTDLEGALWDNIALFDDGLHGDSAAGDDFYANFLPPVIAEDAFRFEHSINYAGSQQILTYPEERQVTSIGPVICDTYQVSSSGNRLSVTLTLRNLGQRSAAEDLRVEIINDNSWITRIVNNDQYFGTLAVGDIVTSQNPYYIDVDTTAYPGYLMLDLVIKSNGYPYWRQEDFPVGIKSGEQKISRQFVLRQNYPNPFNPTTNIEFSIPNQEFVTLKVFNILGEEVTTLVSDRLSAGSYSYEWDASNLASGVYLYRLLAGEYVETRKMILMR